MPGGMGGGNPLAGMLGGQQPGGAAPQIPGQGGLPIGGSPATQPLANRGQEAAGFAKLGVALKVLQDIVPLVGANSEVGKDVLSALQRLSKHVPTGAISNGVQLSALMDILNKLKQIAPQMQAMQAARQGGALPGAPPSPPGNSPDGAPPPSMAA